MKKTGSITEEQLQKLKQELKQAGISHVEIAERAEVSYRAVMYFMKGESNSRAIYQAAIRLINQKNQNDLEQVVTRQKALSALI